MKHNILLVGCGNLGEILVQKWINKSDYLLTVVESNKQVVNKLRLKYEKLNIKETLKNIDFSGFSTIVLCVKPTHSIKLISDISQLINIKNCFISLVAGLETSRIKNLLPKKVNIFRVMPNILLSIDSSSTAIYSSEGIKSSNKKKIEDLFNSSGAIIWLNDENKFDFFTSMFGGGPAYLFYILDEMISLTIENGIDSKSAKKLVFSLLHGTSEYIKVNDQELKNHISKVASKGGTTQEVLKNFSKKNQLYNLLKNSIRKGTEKSEVLRKNIKQV